MNTKNTQGNPADRSFKMIIWDPIPDKKPETKVVGIIESGEVRVNDEVWLIRKNGSQQKVTVIGIETYTLFRKVPAIGKGKEAFLILKGVEPEEVEVGQILCGESHLPLSPSISNTNATAPNSAYSHGQIVFARFNSGKYYFPATIAEIIGNKVKVNFLDGDKGTMPIEDIMDLQKAFKVMKLEGNYKNWGSWYKGNISNTNPLTMNYDDGDVEKIKLVQLRGTCH